MCGIFICLKLPSIAFQNNALHRPIICRQIGVSLLATISNSMRSLFFLAAILFACGARAQLRQTFLDTDENNTIHKIHFISPTEGFVAFEKWIGYTQDSGRTFAKRYITLSNVNYNGYSVNLTFGFDINGVHAFNSSNILVYGDYGFVPAILSSTDGGKTFVLVYQGVFNPDYLYRGVLDVYFAGAVGYALVDNQILKTTNSGISWNRVYTNANTDFLRFNFLDAQKGFAIANGGLVKTSDGGSTWQPIGKPSGYLRDASFTDELNGWIVQDGVIYKTSNGGTSWDALNGQDNFFSESRLRFFNDTLGYAFGAYYTVLKTTDGGKYWEKLSRDNRFSYLGFGHEDLYFFDANRFWAGGGYGFLEITTNDGGATVPLANFVVDYSGLNTTNTIGLINKTKPGHTYKWFRNSTLFATTYDASYVPDGLSIDTIRLVVTKGNLADTAEQILDTRANPGYRCYAAFAQSVDTSMLTFTASDSTLDAKHTWFFGDGSIPFVGVRGSHRYDSVGTYEVKHVVSSEVYGCRDSSLQTVTVVRTRNCLISDFTYAADSFFTNRLVFKPSFSRKDESADAAQTILGWNWGDGKPTEGGYSHEYDAPGRYDVCLNVQNLFTRCVNSVCKPVYVYMDTACNADFFVNQNVYEKTVTFTGKPTVHTTGVRNTWTINGRPAVETGNTSSFKPGFFQENLGETNFDLTDNSCHYPATLELCLDSLKRTLTRTVYDSATGCTNTITKSFEVPRSKNVFIRDVPNPAFPQQHNFYAYELDSRGDTVPYGYSSRWRIEGGGSSHYTGGYNGASTTLPYTFASSGNYTVAIASNNCNWSGQREVYYINVHVTIDSCPINQPDFYTVVDTTKERTIQFLDPTLNANMSLSNTWKWYFGDGDSSAGVHPAHTYENSGTYIVKLVYTNPNGCTKQITKPVVVAATICTVQAAFSMPSQAQAARPVTFTNTSANSITNQWDFGDGSASAEESPVHIFANQGIYAVRLIARNGICLDTIIKNLVVLPAADTCILQPDFISVSDSTQPRKLTFLSTSVASQNATANWSFGDGTSATGLQTTHFYNQYGRYQVCLTIKDSICEKSRCDSFDILPPSATCSLRTSFIFIADTVQRRKFSFLSTSVTTPNATLVWDFGDGTYGTGWYTDHLYSNDGHYKVCLTIKDSICERSYCDSVFAMTESNNGVAVYPNPVNDVLKTTFSLNNAENTHLLIYSQSGLLVKQQTIMGHAGKNIATFDLKNVQPGLYILRIVPDVSSAMAVRFMKL